MSNEILMPALSPTMEEGTLAKWLISEGDTISSGEQISGVGYKVTSSYSNGKLIRG